MHISRMDQGWINDGWLVPSLLPLATPDDLLLEFAPPPQNGGKMAEM